MCQAWLAPPLQSHSCTRVPPAVDPPGTSRHRPRARTVPSPGNVHHCALEPLQVYSWTGVPFASRPQYTSTHFPASPVISPDRAPPAVSSIALTSDGAVVMSRESSQFIIPPALARAHWVLR